MARGIGAVEAIQSALPDWLSVVFALLTQLGDIWFLACLLAVLYWFNVPDQDDVATLAGVWIAGMGLYKGLKSVFGFPRPDRPLLEADLLPWVVRPLYEATAFATGYGFPSGHAVNTTIVYVGLAYLLSVGTPRRRFGVAGVLVATVSFTRVALGLHYLIDVLAGVAVGVTLLCGAGLLIRWMPNNRTTVPLGLGVGFAGFFFRASDADPDAIFLLGAALGAFAGWQFVVLGRELVAISRPSVALRPLALRGGLATIALAPVVAALEVFPFLSVYSVGGVVGLLATGIVVVPVLRYSERARRVGVAVTFWLRMAVVGTRYLCRPSTWRRAGRLVRRYSVKTGRWLRSRWRRARSNSDNE
ncbi:phosphatase PAP2 family protein [Halopiger goleimassiliensis]|uniref:phosphatase PAP2 family protein n=1 Tax=Halopiger goleimassiliensis TaxID=1293048 RepID=UPI000677EEBD|nr:phosphatase PAP2 family protein [Halopiger goleimassiliensis]